MAKQKTFYCDAYIFDEKVNGKNVKGLRPVYKTNGAACADVAIPYAYDIPAHKTVKLDLLIMLDIPVGYKVIMYPRSSLLVKKGIMSPVSIIDADYKGHIHVLLHNLTDDVVHIDEGERVVQIECVPCGPRPDNWIRENNARDINGFGGTGTI